MYYNKSESNVVPIKGKIAKQPDRRPEYRNGYPGTDPIVVLFKPTNLGLERHNQRVGPVVMPRMGCIAGIVAFVVSAAAMAAAIQILAVPQVQAWHAELVAAVMRGLPRF